MVTDIKTKAKEAIAKAKKEINEEELEKGVVRLKKLLREEQTAQTVVDNIKREIADCEAAIEQGNV